MHFTQDDIPALLEEYGDHPCEEIPRLRATYKRHVDLLDSLRELLDSLRTVHEEIASSRTRIEQAEREFLAYAESQEWSL